MDHLVTRTLAEIYLQQGHFQKAYSLFKTLSERDPDDVELKDRLKELEEKVKFSHTSASKKIENLEKWLNNIRERRNP